ncbi:HLH transcription factor [Rhodotorula toruloides]|uniref:HLH transcription factor n=1 Tax=Rhodotorula toruloides TaxID=5286 RepID=A0A511KDA5_RHOTO|nr:HLH transcription factor [Rhodotorula toruloides]
MPPPDPAPLFDSTETALFSSFLNTLDVDPNFLFNPVLPPGMPSPPNTSMLQTGERREEDRREREMLGREVRGLDIGSSSAVAGLVSPTGRTADRVPPELPDELDDELAGGDEDDELDDADAGEEDPDFELAPSRGTRRKSRGGPVAATGREKKPRTIKSEAKAEFTEGEDVEMAAADDGDYVDGAGFTASGRPRRNALPPATLDCNPVEDADDAFDSASATATASSSTPKVPLTESQKRNNHILSEQKRRNAIRSGFKDLVDLLVAGEQASGIVLGGPEEDDGTGKKKKGKGSGRGRGRKGEVGANASKSVVLTKASDYILWLERGNRALEQEVRRVQGLLQHVSVQE